MNLLLKRITKGIKETQKDFIMTLNNIRRTENIIYRAIEIKIIMTLLFLQPVAHNLARKYSLLFL